MTYDMAVWSGENDKRTYQNPKPEVIARAIDDLIPAPFRFITLEAKPPVEQCAYIQTLIEREGKMKGFYLVEARYVFDGYFRHYRKHTRDVSMVKKLFRQFAEGIAPNVAGWEDITESMIANK